MLAILLMAGVTLVVSPVGAFREACSNGIAVPDPEKNPELVNDCSILLEIRHALLDYAGHWDSKKPISQWRGIGISCCPNRVTRILFNDYSDSPRPKRIPNRIAAIEGLEILWLPKLKLHGSIPSAITELTELRILNLSGNQLTGVIPETIGYLYNLQDIDLSANHLTGTIPRSLGEIANLQSIRLQWNELEGIIPPAIASLRELRELWLHKNRLTGQIPASMGEYGIEWLRISDNHFTGCVPRYLRTIARNDVDRIDLPDCPPAAAISPVAPPDATVPEQAPPDAAPPVTGTGLADPNRGADGVLSVLMAVAVAACLRGVLVLLRRRA